MMGKSIIRKRSAAADEFNTCELFGFLVRLDRDQPDLPCPRCVSSSARRPVEVCDLDHSDQSFYGALFSERKFFGLGFIEQMDAHWPVAAYDFVGDIFGGAHMIIGWIG